MKKNFLYSFYIAVFVGVLFLLFSMPVFKGILFAFELKSYDLRQNINLKQKLVNPNIVILAIDDNSLEILEKKYGSWPWNRQAYVDAINTLNKFGARQIILDLMFVSRSKNMPSDYNLIQTVNQNKNVFVGMNLDNREDINTKPMPADLASDVIDKSSIQFPTYTNYRPILREIMTGSKNVGMLNCQRDFDGISRTTPSFLKYKGKYYPYLGLMASADYFGVNNYEINEKNELILNKNNYPLQENGSMILNWYDDNFKVLPFWKLEKAKDELKGKIVFIGVTATSMYDIKTTPVNRNAAGIELQSTMLNNFLDNNFIKKTSDTTTLITAIVLSVIIGLFTLQSYTAFASLSLCLGLLGGYIVASIFLLNYFNLWVDMIFVILAVFLTFVFSYVVKFKNKARDFEQTYKLATTDSMTGLYNHRFFQEQMVMQIENAKRYDAKFSLLLIDIDFFKKFNDNYGHQAGDAVLKQVAELLKKSVRTSDIVARYGGEEMAIILPSNDFENAFIAAEKICNKIAQTPFALNSKVTKNVTISLGVATFPDNGQTPAELIEFADKGLYKAKENGRNQVGQV
ncbi:MAG: diguanylate cyclase [bacterium]